MWFPFPFCTASRLFCSSQLRFSAQRERHVAEAANSAAKAQMDTDTYEIRHKTLTRTMTGRRKKKKHCITINRWKLFMRSFLSSSIQLSLSLSGKGSAVLLSRGSKYGSCQRPYDAACVAYTRTQAEKLRERTWSPRGQWFYGIWGCEMDVKSLTTR